MKRFAAYLLLAFILSPYAILAAAACPGGNDSECSDPTPVCDTSVKPYVCVASDAAGQGAGNVHSGGVCKIDGDCYGDLACLHGTCQIDPNLEGSGTVGVGGACTTNDQCAGDLTCGANKTCQGSTGAPATKGATITTSFVPLSNIPALTDTAGAPDLSSFLNQLYKICIGAAVVLTVVQLIRAGITYMTAAGNVGSVDGAKKLILSSLLGLLLVLSPVIVFTIINPQILSLSLNTGGLTSGLPAGGAAKTIPLSETWPCSGANGTDCTAARNKCASLTTEKSSGTLECIGKDGQLLGDVGKVACSTAAGNTYAVRCTGTTPANGAGQGGISPDSVNATMAYDAGYMDVAKFVGETADADSKNYQCQNGSSQIHDTPFTCVHNGPKTCVFVLCYTEKLTYLVASSPKTGMRTTPPATQKIINTYERECIKANSTISSSGASLTFKNNQSDDFDGKKPKEVACTDLEQPYYANDGGTKCFQTSASCNRTW